MGMQSPPLSGRRQLAGWYTVESTWPNHRDWATFERWFEWSSHSMVIDLCAGRLKREPL